MYHSIKDDRKDLAQKLFLIFAVIVVLLFIGMLVYHFSEGWTYTQSLYFATISLTSRGYSNLYPSHWFSVFFSIFYLLLGVAIIIYALSTLVAFYTSYYQKGLQQRFNHFLEQFKVKKKKHEEKEPDTWLVIKPRQ